MPNDQGSTEKNEKITFAQRMRLCSQALTDLFSDGKNEKKVRVFALLLTSLLLTLLILPNQHFITAKFSAGEIASTDIKATQGYLLEDHQLTEKKRAAAQAAIPYVYAYNPRKAEELSEAFSQSFSLIMEARQGNGASSDNLRRQVAEALGCEVTNAQINALQKLRPDGPLLAEISRLADTVFDRKIVADKRIFSDDSSHGIQVVDSETGEIVGGSELALSPFSLEEAKNRLRKMKLHGGDSRNTEIVKLLLIDALKPNLVFDREATEARKREAAASVQPVMFQIKRGEMIVREGERISEEQALKLNKIFEVRQGINKYFSALGIFGLILVVFYFPYRFSQKNIRKFNPGSKDLLLLALVTLLLFLLFRIAHNVAPALGLIFPHIDTSDYFYLFPFAAGPMLVRIILNSEVALVYGVACAPLLGILFNSSLPVVIYALLGGIIGAHGVRQCKNRNTIYIAGLKVSVVNLALAVPFQILDGNMFTLQSVYVMIFALVGGVVNALMVSGTIPIVESVFQYTTDIKLLELSNLNSPVLRELMIRAPGTYHHSVLVGSLVESAAEAINANPLLARVAAYYHDIGKISKPLYFIENTKGGENRHDKLSPSMSALILISHVKEGVELAKENRLGLPIINIIRQHHGTALIKFFFQKAKSNEEPDTHSVDELDFRYPGPKPQTREAGLVLLADSVEAASKTLTDPTPARIQGMVQKIINNIFIDGQLEECELSLKSLHEIAKSFNRVLSGIYHHRIDYPEPVYKGSERKKNVESTDREQAKTPPDSTGKTEKGSGEDLKRLGISR